MALILNSTIASNQGTTTNPISDIPKIFLTGYNYTNGNSTWNDLSPYGRNALCTTGTPTNNGRQNQVYLNGGTTWTCSNLAAGNAWTTVIWMQPIACGVNGCLLTQKLNTTINLCFGNQDGSGNTIAFGTYGAAWPGLPLTLASYTTTNCFTGSWDGNNLKTYVNGTLVNTKAGSGSAVDNSESYRIGQRWDSADFITAYVGEIRVYGRALSAAEIQADYYYTKTVRPYI